jgi:aminoglycoside/choline kinase family phosphotransferase
MTSPSMRESQRQLFLSSIGWQNAECRLLAGDASFRKYWRLEKGQDIRVLMDAPPEHENITPFLHVADTLSAAGLRVPHRYASDVQAGWLLLEDLGDQSFTALLKQQNNNERMVYEAAIDALLHLHAATERLPYRPATYDSTVYLREISLFSDWFLPQALGADAATALRDGYVTLWRDLLEQASLAQSVLVHRDYHADNLLWQPHAQGIARVGMLDFQDALMGDAAYDMVSLLEDARRDVAETTVNACLQRYIAESGEDAENFLRRYAVLGAQRNAKIIGIFTRLAVRDGKPHYLHYLPRVWQHFERDLQHPALAPLKAWVDAHVPANMRHLSQIDMRIGSIAGAA